MNKGKYISGFFRLIVQEPASARPAASAKHHNVQIQTHHLMQFKLVPESISIQIPVGMQTMAHNQITVHTKPSTTN